MANISEELTAIMEAYNGEDVRNSIHDAIDKINRVGEVQLLTGTDISDGDPAGEGFENSLYFRTDSSDLLLCDGTLWNFLVNLKGISIVAITGPVSSPDGLTDTYTIVFSDQTETTFEVHNGVGITNVTGPVDSGNEHIYTIHFNDDTTFDFVVTDGKEITSVTGPVTEGLISAYTINYNDGTTSTFYVTDGNGITEITGPVTEGLDDTYTIVYSDGTSSDFVVHNGNGITEITGPVSDGLIDTYTIHFANGTTKDYAVDNGNGITEITGPVSDGLIDIYTIHFSDGTTQEYRVNNGNTWYRGNIVSGRNVNPVIFPESGIADANAGDFYLNYQEGAIYYCYAGGDPTVASWVFDFVITGSGAVGVQEINDLIDVNLDQNLFHDGQVLTRIGNIWTNMDLPYSAPEEHYDSNSKNAQSGKAVKEAFLKKTLKKTSVKCTPNRRAFKIFNEFKGMSPIIAKEVWTDGSNIYYSSGLGTESYYDANDHFKLNDNTWEPVTFGGTSIFYFPRFYGENIWTDGSNIYYSDGNDQGVLNGTTWESKIWDGEHTAIIGEYVWTDGTNIYYSLGSSWQLKLNGTTWESMTWIGLTDIDGRDIWTDRTNIYYSSGSNQYKLNGTTWESMTWTGLTNFSGSNIWTDGKNIYYSSGSNQYKLNGTTWEPMLWIGLTNFSGSNIWKTERYIYCSVNSNHYKLNGATWEFIDFNGLPIVMDGAYVWTDGKDIYYKDYKKLNGLVWEPMIWNGLYNFNSLYIWTDGSNIYYSNGSNQYKLDGNTWKPTSWSGLTNFSAEYIWTDGSNIYYSKETNHYKLNGTTWEPMTWTGLTNFDGYNIWSNGEYVYYTKSLGLYQYDNYRLDSEMNNWVSVNWHDEFHSERSISPQRASDIWTDGVDVYSITYQSDEVGDDNGFFKLVPNRAGDNELYAWRRIDKLGIYLDYCNGCNIWTDGINIYYSDSEHHYMLNNASI